MERSVVIICFALINSILCVAQPPRPDTTFIAQAKGTAKGLYTKSIGGQSHLYNGSAYTEYISQQEENPYFIDEWLEGTVTYDKEFHENVPLLYDISTDRLIVDNPFSIKKVMLVNERVSAFSIQDHKFIHLTVPDMPEGHYEVAYDGKTKVFVKHRKTMQSRVVDYSIFNEFEEKKLYYILINDRFFPVRGKSSIFSVFGDQKKELKKFARENKLTFGSNKAKDISRVAQYYDQLR